MSLHVRLRHALGERLIELDDRAADDPHIVGRARQAVIKIPSVTVSNQHCAIFVHEDQWMLQDLSGGATWVNGQEMQGPLALCVGDTISVGADSQPATIEIDPAAASAGRRGELAQATTANASRTPQASGAPRGMAGTAVASLGGGVDSPRPLGSASSPAQAPLSDFEDADSGMPADPAATPGPSWDVLSIDQSGAVADWQADSSYALPTASPATYRRIRKPARQTSPAALMVGILLCVAIVGGTVWFLYQKMQTPPEVIKAPAPPPADSGPHNIFTNPGTTEHRAAEPSAAAPDSPRAVRQARRGQASSGDAPSDVAAPAGDSGQGAAAPAGDSSQGAAAPADASTDPGAAPAETSASTNALNDIESAHYESDYAKAIYLFDANSREHPELFKEKLKAYTDEAFDRLWCRRIQQLTRHRIGVTKRLESATADLRIEPSAQGRERITEEKAALEKELSLIDESLTTDMGYTPSGPPPDPTDKAAVEKLAADRDPAKFEAWRLRALNYIRRNHGTVPWEGEPEN